MRSTVRITALIVVLLVLLVPLVVQAKGGPCPDDPVASKNCFTQTPPYFVVANRSFERFGPQYGTGCQPWILENPNCKDCDSGSVACNDAAIDVEQIICGYEMPNAGAQDGDTLIEMCCNCPASDPAGTWMWRERTLQLSPTGAWECPSPGPWNEGLPPGTGIDLPAPVIIGGLGVIGAALLAAGLLVRRRTVRVA